METETQAFMLKFLNQFIDAEVIGTTGVFELDDFKVGLVKRSGLSADELPFDEESDSIIADRLNKHPYLVPAALGRPTKFWRFGANEPPKSREIRSR
jgi:hypothetical protein